ncbi:hypothetical protein PMIN05_011188, partial [Paraphaeosphaeria minitans]
MLSTSLNTSDMTSHEEILPIRVSFPDPLDAYLPGHAPTLPCMQNSIFAYAQHCIGPAAR